MLDRLIVRTDRPAIWVWLGWGAVLAILAVLLYWPARDAGLISDFTGHQMLFEQGATLGWWNSYGWHGNQPVLFGVMKLWYSLFGIQPMPWFWLFTLLHVVNATLVGLLGWRIWQKAVSPDKAWMAALVLSLLFLLHPYQSEVVIWKVCVHYLINVLALVSMMLLLFQAKPLSGWRAWTGFHLIFLIALHALELALIYPVMLLISVGWWGREEGRSREQIRKMMLWTGLPQAVMIIGYLVVNKLRVGTWVGHYGEEVHLKFSIIDLVGNGWNYFLKYLMYTRDWPHQAKEVIAGMVQAHPTFYIVLMGSLILVFFWLVSRSRLSSRLTRANLWALAMFPLAVAPILTLYFAWIGYIENDRYGYLASVFFLLAVQSQLLKGPKWMMWSFWVLLFVLQIHLTRANIDRWVQVQRLYQSLLEDWRWTDQEEVYVLGLPDSYQGITIFRSFVPGETLRDGLIWYAGKPVEGKIREVAAYVVARPSDGVSVRQVDDLTWDVTFNQWGTWFQHKGLGASDYKEEDYEVTFHEGGYRITFFHQNPDRIMVYSDGGRWIRVPIPSN
ncbi:MAG: hypothetical protein K9I85_05355 [Saprospiraceae bacterium]|nr:hypothetical protein [Saprospiraceae bacterium]